MKKGLTLLFTGFFALVIAGIASAQTGISPMVTTPTVLGLLVVAGHNMPVGQMLLSSADVSAISRYAHMFKRQLITTLVNGLDVANDIMVLPGIKSSMKLPKIKANAGFRPYSATKEFKSGDLAYTDREIKVQVGKRELQIDPEDFRDTYLSLTLSPGSGASQKKIPFVEYIWSEIINKVKEEINNKTAYFGFDKTDAAAWLVGTAYSAGDYVTRPVNSVTEYFQAQGSTTGDDPATDDGTNWVNVTAESVVPGLKSYIDAAITASEVSEVGTGAITSGATAVAALRELFRSAPPAYKNSNIIIHASFTDVEWYLDGAETAITKYTTPEVTAMAKNGLVPLIGTFGKGWIKPATWLGDSRRLRAEPMMGAKGTNLVMGTDMLGDANDIATQDDLWTVIAGLKMVLGFQISDTDALWTNDQD